MVDSDVQLAPRGRRFHRQRMPAFVVLVAAIAVVVALSGRTWAELRFEDDGRLDVEVQATGTVAVERGDADDTAGELRPAYLDDSRAPARAALRESVSTTSAEVARVLAAIVALIALAGCLRDLTPATWVLVASTALACLVFVVTLRDRLLAVLADHALTVQLGSTDTHPTVWGAVAIGGAAAAALAAGAAAGPRPLLPRRRARAGSVPIDTTATEAPLDVPPRGPLAAPREDVG